MDKLLMTPCGMIKGITSDIWPEIFAFKGIKYANAERFKYPEEVTKWNGVYDATHFRESCYQERSYHDEKVKKGAFFYFREFRNNKNFSYSENCQFLNIFIPKHVTPDSKLPVMIFIHGGSFMEGGSDEAPFTDPVWPKKFAIAVTINYRLGPFGYMCLPELKEESGHTGNYGFADQITAIQWIKHNIKAFGGDPENITLCGQSAGAMCTYQLCLSPHSKNLISKAAMFSGAGEIPLTIPKPDFSTYKFWNKVYRRTKCKNLNDLRNISSSALFNSWLIEKKLNPKDVLTAKNVIDDFYITEESKKAVKEGHFPDIPYLAGTTSEDLMSPVFYEKTAAWCSKIAEKNKNPVFMYFFDHKLPGDKQGAWHSSDLWYWFGTLKNCWRPMSNDDEILSDYMSSYLVNFATYGNPNPPGLTILSEWKPFTSNKEEAIFFTGRKIKMDKVHHLKLVHSLFSHMSPKTEEKDD